MGLFDFLRPKPKLLLKGRPIAGLQDLPHLYYGVAYFLMPHLFYRSYREFEKLWSDDKYPPGAAMLLTACIGEKLNPPGDELRSIQHKAGEFLQGFHSYLLSFPEVPSAAVDMSLEDLAKSIMEGGRPPTLPPLYAMAIEAPQRRYRGFFVLGKAAGPGTTLRGVGEDGSNVNLGPCADSSPQGFLRAVANHI